MALVRLVVVFVVLVVLLMVGMMFVVLPMVGVMRRWLGFLLVGLRRVWLLVGRRLRRGILLLRVLLLLGWHWRVRRSLWSHWSHWRLWRGVPIPRVTWCQVL